MQLDDAGRAGRLVQAIDVLRHDARQQTLLLQRRDGACPSREWCR